MIPNFQKLSNKILGSSLVLPANGLGGSRATSLLVAHFALQNTKFGSEKGKVQKPARIPPQTPPAGGKKAEAVSYDFTKSENWRCFLIDVRTFFAENPEN